MTPEHIYEAEFGEYAVHRAAKLLSLENSTLEGIIWVQMATVDSIKSQIDRVMSRAR